MAEALIGDIVGRLRIDTADWQRGLQQAQQQLAQFQQAMAQVTSGQSAQAASTNQLAASYLALATEIANQTAVYTQVQMATMQYRREQDALRDSLRQQREEQQRTAQATRDASGGMLDFGRAWHAALSVAGGVGLATTIEGIIGSLKSLISESVQAAARLETLRAQFTALQGANQAAVTLQNVFQTAQRLGVEFDTLAGSFRAFMAATQGTALEGMKAERVFGQITTGARAMGASSQETSQALFALQQMISKGTVSMEELRRQLGNALPGAMGIAARAFGVTTEEMTKMIEKGMDATQFVQAFAAQVEREFGGKAAIATNTLTAAWTRFSNELEQFGGALASSTIVESLRNIVEWSTKLLENLRAAREFRQAQEGPPITALPKEITDVGPRDILARQQRLLDLQMQRPLENIASLLGPQAFQAALAKWREQMAALQKEQADAVKRFQEQMAAEADQPGPAAATPGNRAVEAIRKIQEDLRKTLRDIDMTAAFVTPLELAETRLKAIEEAFKKMREAAGQMGEGLRAALTPLAAKPTQFDTLIAESAARYGVPYNIARALVQKESGFDPTATSRAGAMGLTQLMPGTARQMGVPAGEEYDHAKNLDAGMKYLSQLLAQFKGDWEKALTAYNAGPGRGGIPLPYGENATYARDVLRIAGPTTPGTALSAMQAQLKAAQDAVEAAKPDLEARKRRRETWEQLDIFGLMLSPEEEANLKQMAQEQKKRIQEAAKELDIFGIELSPEEEANRKQMAEEQKKRIQEFAKNLDIFGLEVSPELEAQRRAGTAFDLRLRQQIEQAQLQRIQRPEGRLRAEAERQGVMITPEREEQLKELTRLREEQERLNEVIGIWRDLSQGVGSAWVNALTSIADGTKTVAQAFRAMGQSIMKTMADIAAQQAFQAIFKIGAGLLTSMFMPTVTPGMAGTAAQGAAVGTTPFGPGAFFTGLEAQGGAVITRPTTVLAGENPSNNPEFILNRFQMNSLLANGGGGRGGAVSIHNYPSRAEAENGAARDRAQGRQAVVNEVLADLSQGEGSRINRAMRLMQR